jgi:hypothetical protein
VPPTATPIEQSCVVNQLQLKCQAEVVIENVLSSSLSATSEELCWDTNIETKGIVRYGLSTAAAYDQTTTFEETYTTINHCFMLSNLVNNSKYNYQIEADSPAGKSAIYLGNFVLGVETLPATGATTPSCIALDSAVSFNSSNQAIVKYSTASSGNCIVSYGNSSNKTAFQSTTSNGTSHTSLLGLDNLDSKTDGYYQINCDVDATSTDQAKTCTYNDVIIASQYVPYLNSQSTVTAVLNTASAVFSNFTATYFGTPVKTSQTLNTTAVAGTAVTAVIATVAYPQWLSYGLLWIRGKKKPKPWGLVYNENTLIPVAFATVRAVTSAGIDIKQAITDTTGRFGFVLDPGTYKITVDASGLDHYEKSVTVAAEQAINLDIPLVGAGKLDVFTALQHKVKSNLGKISIIITVIGYLFTVTSVILVPNIVNILVLVVYFVQSGILVFSLKVPGNGYIFNSKTNERVKGAFVRLYDLEEQRQVDVQMADDKGRYNFIGDKKEYLLRVDAPGYKFPGSETKGEIVKTAGGGMFVKSRNEGGIHEQIALDPL